jgi:hypothetical protein
MPSYQDLQTRVETLERMLGFLMTNMRMTATVSSGLAGPDGKPVPSKKFEGSLLELYRISQAEALPVANQSTSEPPPVIV